MSCDAFALSCPNQPIDFGVFWFVAIPIGLLILALIVFSLVEKAMEKK